MKTIVIYNAKSHSNTGDEVAKHIEKYLDGEIEFVNSLEIADFNTFFKKYEKGTKFVMTGGDGTLNYFVNHIEEENIPQNFFYYPSGTGNDFWTDIEGKEEPINIYQYLVGLPTVTINGKTSKFINGVGYGIDGYCCEVADIKAQKSTKPINYAGIAIGGLLLFKYKPCAVKVTIDGVEHVYKKAWLAPVMHGKHYGGGMIATPAQDRNNKDHIMSCLIFKKAGRLGTLLTFKNIFTGTHIKNKKRVVILEGKNIVVEFAKPRAAQIDGETVSNVLKMECKG